MYQGTAPTNIDVWDQPGGQKVGHIRQGTTFTGDQSSTPWVRLNFSAGGHSPTYTKKTLLGTWYRAVPVTPPPTPEPQPGPELPAGMDFVRVLHECELPGNRRSTPARMPQVRPLFPNHFSPFAQGWQQLSRQLNPLLSAGNMTAVYHYRLWIANRQGFGNSEDPRANHFEGKNLTKPLPKVEALTCGGNLLRVVGEGWVKTNAGMQACYLIETLDWYDPPPPVEWVIAHPWLITEATKLDGDGRPTRFPQGRQPNGYQPGVRHPLIAKPESAIEKWRVIPWCGPLAPDPLKVYGKE